MPTYSTLSPLCTTEIERGLSYGSDQGNHRTSLKKGLFTRDQIHVIKKIESERALNGFWKIIE